MQPVVVYKDRSVIQPNFLASDSYDSFDREAAILGVSDDNDVSCCRLTEVKFHPVEKEAFGAVQRWIHAVTVHDDSPEDVVGRHQIATQSDSDREKKLKHLLRESRA